MSKAPPSPRAGQRGDQAHPDALGGAALSGLAMGGEMPRRKPPETIDAAISAATEAGADEAVLRRLLEEYTDAAYHDQARRPPLSAARLRRIQAHVRAALEDLGVSPIAEPPIVQVDDYGIIAGLTRVMGSIARALRWPVEEQGRPPAGQARAIMAAIAEYLHQTTGSPRWEIVATLVGSPDAVAARNRAKPVKREARRARLRALLHGPLPPAPQVVETQEPTHR